MLTYKYSDHSISLCKYIYALNNVNVESRYIGVNGFSNLKLDISSISNDRRISIQSEDIKEENLLGYFTKTFNLPFTWNILAITNADLVPLSIIYDTYPLNTREVNYIKLKYLLNYSSSAIDVTLDIGEDYRDHIEEYKGSNMQPIPKLLSRNGEESKLLWKDPATLKYDSGIVKDSISSKDYSLFYKLNENLEYHSTSRYFMTGTTQTMYAIEVDDSNEATIYPLNNNISFTIGELPIEKDFIAHMELVENGNGIILVDLNSDIYYAKALYRRPDLSWGEFEKVNPTPGFKILIPTFIDLCGCYIKVPDPSIATPTAYEVKKWTSLFNESGTYGDRIYISEYNNPNSIAPGDCTLRTQYWESLGILNNATYFLSSNINQNSPVSMHQFEVVSPREGNSVILDFNLRMMTELYVDLFNPGRLSKIVIPRDCGLEIINENGKNDFITYTGDHYILPNNAQVMNMSYFIDSTITSLVDGHSQDISQNILCAKYGIILTQEMING